MTQGKEPNSLLTNRPHLIPALIAGAFLLGALAKWPYGYYVLRYNRKLCIREQERILLMSKFFKEPAGRQAWKRRIRS
jgi:hypothetical protein